MTSFAPETFFNLEAFAHHALFAECENVWEALSRIGDYLKSLQLGVHDGEVSKDAYLVRPELISIGKGTVVEPGAYICGPCVIGENASVRHGAYIRGNCLAGDGCVIGHATEVKNAVFMNEAKAGHFAYVGDSILGHHVNLGAGTKLANLKLDEKEVLVERKGTGLKKFGAILGDRASLGCNAVTNPGTIMGKEALCYPCTGFGGVIPSGHIVRPGTHFEVTAPCH